MRPSNIITYLGSAVAIVGGLGTTLHAQTAPPSTDSHNYSLAGLVAAFSGLVAAIYPQLQLGIKLWLEDRRQEREVKIGRTETDAKLRIAQLQIDELRQSERELAMTLKYNREVVAAFAHKLGLDLPPMPTFPDRHPAPDEDLEIETRPE